MFSQTLKVEENKVPLVFSILALGLKYSHFLIFCRPHRKGPSKSLENGYVSAPESKLKKTKGTLFSSTFKVGENKVPLVFLNF